jgi:hypothetical protein
LILACTSLLALSSRTTQTPIRTGIISIGRQGKLDRDLILACQICIADLAIWNLERRSILNVEL